MTKLIKAGAAVAVLAGIVLALPASASAGEWEGGCRRVRSRCCNVSQDNDKVVVKTTNFAHVESTTFAVSNTGDNEQKWNDDGNKIKTGKAWSKAESTNVVNVTSVDINVD